MIIISMKNHVDFQNHSKWINKYSIDREWHILFCSLWYIGDPADEHDDYVSFYIAVFEKSPVDTAN